MHKSKYLNKKYSGWKVIDCEITPDGRHTRFTLVKKLLGIKKTMVLRDNALRQIELGNKSIKDYIKGKQFQLSNNIHIEMNTIKTSFSLF